MVLLPESFRGVTPSALRRVFPAAISPMRESRLVRSVEDGG